jgi:peroxiredoxin Q/BCP
MKIAEIRELTIKELAARKREIRQEIFNLRIQQQAGQLEKPHMLRSLRVAEALPGGKTLARSALRLLPTSRPWARVGDALLRPVSPASAYLVRRGLFSPSEVRSLVAEDVWRPRYDAIRAFDVSHFAVSVDSPENLRKFANQLAVDYPVLSDPTRKVAKAYGVVKDDNSYAVRWTYYIGQDGRILFIDKAVHPGTHGEAVAEKLAELGVPHRAIRGS